MVGYNYCALSGSQPSEVWQPRAGQKGVSVSERGVSVFFWGLPLMSPCCEPNYLHTPKGRDGKTGRPWRYSVRRLIISFGPA